MVGRKWCNIRRMLFDDLNPVEDNIFYRRGDVNDVRFGEVVYHEPADYEHADVVIVGCPQDEGVLRNRGRGGARLAPAEIRKALYRYPMGEAHKHLRLIDIGDIRIRSTLEQTHELLYETVYHVLSDGKKIVVLGGGNDISYPDCKALSAQTECTLVFNIDRHLDVRADVPRNSGTPYRQLLDEGIIHANMFHAVGINSFANSVKYQRYVEDIGAHIHYLGYLRKNGVGDTVRAIVERSDADSIFFGFDLDVVRAVEAPGVSDPSPMGLTAREVCEIADIAASDQRTRLLEITEVNPTCDVNGITSKLAANIIVRALAKVDR